MKRVMENIKDIIAKWGFVAFLVLVGVGLLFGIGSAIYTSIDFHTVGIISLAGIMSALGIIVASIIKEIKK